MQAPENQGKFLIMDMGAKGASEFKERYRNAIFIYIIPPNKEALLERMKNRNPSRLQRSKRQLPQAKKVCDWLVINDDLDEAVDQIEQIMHIIKKHGQSIRTLDDDTLRFLYSRNLHNKENVKFLDEFYGKDLSYPDGPEN